MGRFCHRDCRERRLRRSTDGHLNPNVDNFIAEHQLPEKFRRLIEAQYVPIVAWLERQPFPLLLGINGAQGTGKSTLADYLRQALKGERHVAVLSIDDFYLTKTERAQLAANVHPLLITRGVPGTHDLPMLSACLEQLNALEPGRQLPLPRFDKASDDRADPATWPVISGPIDLIILEGWCVGSLAQPDDELEAPINALERGQDADGSWRRYVNAQLAGDYASLFNRLDALIFLQAPNFDAVYRWRLEQEEKLAARTKGAGVMDAAGIARFIQYYERLTRANLAALPALADVVLEFDDAHDCVRSNLTAEFTL